jgi:RNA polymerase sigma-70 factor (ECF subfamily)
MPEDREARFLRIVNEHVVALRRLTFGYERDPGRRQDLEQEILLAVWLALPTFAGQCSERTFVFRVAHNRAISHVRHWRLRATDPLDDEEPIATTEADPETAASHSQRRTVLAAAIRSLPLGLRQVILLLLEGLNHREIGEVLGISEGNVAVRAARARKALAEALAVPKER